MAEEKQPKLTWYHNDMEWRDKDGNVYKHERYANSPVNLEGKSFIKGYLAELQSDNPSLNSYMKTHQKFTAKEVKDAAKKFRALYEAANPGMTFALLREKKIKKNAKQAKQEKALAEAIAELHAVTDAKKVTKEKVTRPRKPKK